MASATSDDAAAGHAQHSDNVIVAVRCKPFTDEERGASDDAGICCVAMPAGTGSTILTTPGTMHMARPMTRKFHFDHCFWSHEPRDSHYANQGKYLTPWAPCVLQRAGPTIDLLQTDKLDQENRHHDGRRRQRRRVRRWIKRSGLIPRCAESCLSRLTSCGGGR